MSHVAQSKTVSTFSHVKMSPMSGMARNWPFSSKTRTRTGLSLSLERSPKASCARAALVAKARKGEGKSASGLSLPQAWIFKSQALPGSSVTKSKATIYKSVEASWHNDETGDREVVLEGEGSPKFEITHPHATKEEAERAAKSKLDEQSRAAHTTSIKLIGNPIYRAEGQMLAVGFRPGVPFLWSIKSVSHQIAGGGFTTQIEGELPKVG